MPVLTIGGKTIDEIKEAMKGDGKARLARHSVGAILGDQQVQYTYCAYRTYFTYITYFALFCIYRNSTG